jgi:subtilisin-like proprotein convertase family protein
MNKQLGILMLLLVALISRADTTNATFSTTLSGGGLSIPDANPVGVTSTLNVSGMSGSTTNITVNLDITGGFTGDLYAYLISPTGTMVVLVNRVGENSGNYFGYSDSGFNVTFDSASTTNIHTYQSGSYTLNGSSQLTGTWATDSRTISPLSAPSAFDAGPTGNTLSAFDGYNPNGTWTLFVADLAGGGQSTLVSWGLSVVTVPEPQTWTILGGGLAALILANRRRR